MRVERIQPELRQAEGTVVSNHIQNEQGKVLGTFLTPLSASVQQTKGRGKTTSLERLEEKVKQLNETVEIFHKRSTFRYMTKLNALWFR